MLGREADSVDPERSRIRDCSEIGELVGQHEYDGVFDHSASQFEHSASSTMTSTACSRWRSPPRCEDSCRPSARHRILVSGPCVESGPPTRLDAIRGHPLPSSAYEEMKTVRH